MNKNHQITDQAELEEFISRYFNGETTIQEEQAFQDRPLIQEEIEFFQKSKKVSAFFDFRVSIKK